jgi:hypothetical protein
MVNKKKHRLSIKTPFDTQRDDPSKTRINNSDPKGTTEGNKEITIIGIVREIEGNWQPCRVGIAAENGSYVVRMIEEGKNLQYEVGNKVEATGFLSKTKDGVRQITVTGYEVYEMSEDDPEEFGYGLE